MYSHASNSHSLQFDVNTRRVRRSLRARCAHPTQHLSSRARAQHRTAYLPCAATFPSQDHVPKSVREQPYATAQSLDGGGSLKCQDRNPVFIFSYGLFSRLGFSFSKISLYARDARPSHLLNHVPHGLDWQPRHPATSERTPWPICGKKLVRLELGW